MSTTTDGLDTAAPSSSVVFALGSNGSGQLGTGHGDDSSRPQECLFETDKNTDQDSNPKTTIGGRVEKIVAGGNHTLLLTRQGRAFVAGNDQGGQSPKREKEKDETNFDSNSIFREIRIHDFVGISPTTTATQTPKIISDVAATWEASFFVVNRASVFVQGTGSKGELGLGQDVCQVERPTKVFDVDGLDDTAVVTADVAAAAAAGAGPVDTTTTTTKPKPTISSIAASMSHVVVVLSDGRCCGWGNCRKGQLGGKHRKDKILWRPTRIDEDFSSTFQPEGVVVGREYTAFLSCGKRLSVWGETKGFDFDGQALTHKLNKQDTVVSGWSAIHILSSPTLMSTGKNHRGQLAPINLPTVTALAAGSEHCVAVTTNQRVIAWGWGEHGNCGEEVDHKGNVAGRWNVISLPLLSSGEYRVEAVAAGCATTFVICEKRPQT